MEGMPAPGTSPAELTVETVREWRRELTDVERRLGARFARWDAQRRAGAYLRGLRRSGGTQKRLAGSGSQRR